MSLTTTLNIAQQALSTNAALSTIVSRNIAGVNDPNYSTKTGQLETTLAAASGSRRPQRHRRRALRQPAGRQGRRGLVLGPVGAGSTSSKQTLGLSTTTAADGTSTDTSPATLIGKLSDALGQYAASPANATLGAAAVTAAKALAANLNAASRRCRACARRPTRASPRRSPR